MPQFYLMARTKPRAVDAARIAKLERKAYQMECDLAEFIAETDSTLAQAAEHFGLSYPSITIYWRRARARLGWQAC